MPEPAPTPVAPLSKGAIFLRRLSSFVVLWGIVLGSLFSGNKVLSDYVFILILLVLAAAGLHEFYGMVRKLGYACYSNAGIFGGLLLLVATFCYISGEFGKAAPPSRVNDFETSLFVLFVLGLCIRQFVSKHTTTGIVAISTTLLGLMYVPWLLNFIQKINFFGRGVDGHYYILYFVIVTKFSDSGAYVVGSLIGRHKMIPRISPGKDVGGILRRDCRLNSRQRHLCQTGRGPVDGNDDHARGHFGSRSERGGCGGRFDRVAFQARGRPEGLRPSLPRHRGNSGLAG